VLATTGTAGGAGGGVLAVSRAPPSVRTTLATTRIVTIAIARIATLRLISLAPLSALGVQVDDLKALKQNGRFEI
jgi:hypothetical protein